MSDWADHYRLSANGAAPGWTSAVAALARAAAVQMQSRANWTKPNTAEQGAGYGRAETK